MKANPVTKLLAFLERLDQAKIAYTMEHSRDDAIMICIVSPGTYWEIEFLDDGEIEVERYRSNGEIEDECVLEELFSAYADPDSAGEETRKSHDAVARE